MSKKKFPVIISTVIFALVVLGGTAGYMGYYYYTQYNLLKTNPQLLSAQQTQQIVSQIGQLMQLPTDEIPQVATVMNPTLVQSHSPFSHAETGDVILIYMKIKRAILYRPHAHKIIDVAPVILGTPNPTPTNSIRLKTTPSAKPTLRVSNTNK